MMSPEKLREIQGKALAAVNDMPDGDLKTKAFEVFLNHLLSLESPDHYQQRSAKSEKVEPKAETNRKPGTLKSRILLLKDEGYFEVPRIMSDIKHELQAHGWVHANTAMSGPLQDLVQERLLRRVKEKVWKYVNP